MATKPRPKKPLKAVKKKPTTLSVGEVLGLQNRLHKVELLRKETATIKARLDNIYIQKQSLEIQAVLQDKKIIETNAALKTHGERIMALEKSYNTFRTDVCEKYGVKAGEFSYDPDTLELTSKGD